MGSLWLNSFLKLLSGPETLLITNPWGPLMTQRPQDLPFYTLEKRCCYCLVSPQSVENGSTSQSPSGFSESLLAYWRYGRLAETPKTGAPRLANTRFNNSHDIKKTATLTTPLVEGTTDGRILLHCSQPRENLGPHSALYSCSLHLHLWPLQQCGDSHRLHKDWRAGRYSCSGVGFRGQLL